MRKRASQFLQRRSQRGLSDAYAAALRESPAGAMRGPNPAADHALRQAQKRGTELTARVVAVNGDHLILDVLGSRALCYDIMDVVDGEPRLPAHVRDYIKVAVTNVTRKYVLVSATRRLTPRVTPRAHSLWRPGDVVQAKVTGVGDLSALVTVGDVPGRLWMRNDDEQGLVLASLRASNELTCSVEAIDPDSGALTLTLGRQPDRDGSPPP